MTETERRFERVAGKIRESKDASFGFNAQTEEYGDMFKFGVIDPDK